VNAPIDTITLPRITAGVNCRIRPSAARARIANARPTPTDITAVARSHGNSCGLGMNGVGPNAIARDIDPAPLHDKYCAENHPAKITLISNSNPIT
jgi:hypothetical protein